MTTRRWDKSKPPTGPFVLNKDCQQAQGLVCWYPWGGAGAGYDLVDGNHHVVQSVTTLLGQNGEPVGVFNRSPSLLISNTVPVYTAPLAVSVWFNKTTAADTTYTGLACFGDWTLNSGPRRFQFDTYNGSLRWLAVGASVGTASITGIQSGKWHHALGTEESTASRYAVLDGIASAQETTSATPGGTQNKFIIGGYFNLSTYEYFDGRIGEVCVWSKGQYENRALLADPGRRFELWYPLRSRKWISISSGSTGTLATTNANDTSAASGTTTVLGTLAKTNVNDTSAASGTTTVTGSLARTNANDTVVASGSVGNEVSGTVATTNANDTVSAAGTTTVSGTLAITNANDTSAANGTTTVKGALATTNANDAVSASGIAGAITGTSNTTNANDTSSAQGSTPDLSQASGGYFDIYTGRKDYPITNRKLKKKLVKILEEQDYIINVIEQSPVKFTGYVAKLNVINGEIESLKAAITDRQQSKFEENNRKIEMIKRKSIIIRMLLL